MSFAETLRRLRIKAGKSRYRLWEFSGLDQSYIARLENGKKVCPSRNTVILLGMGLLRNSNQIELYDIEELLLAADYAPLRKRDITREIKTSPSNKQPKD
ncbi:helix-turn-helix domain-containing protein [Chloroflexota bacterium]